MRTTASTPARTDAKRGGACAIAFGGLRTGAMAASLAGTLLLAGCLGDGATRSAAGAGEAPGMRAQAASFTRAPTVLINEVMSANLKGATDTDGDAKDWVELYNTTGSAVDLAGWGLSNKATTPFRWVFPTGSSIPARGYLRVWLSQKDRSTPLAELHTNFNIDNGADDIVLSAPDGSASGVLVDSTTPALTRPDVSWCRSTNGSPTAAFVHCLVPTPRAANTGLVYTSMAAAPTLSVASGVFASGFSVSATGPAGATLRYTTDGSEPTPASPVLDAPVAVGNALTLRVSSFAIGQLPSPAATGTYVVDATGSFAGQRRVFVTLSPGDAAAFKGGATTTQGWPGDVEMVEPSNAPAFKAPAVLSDAGQVGSRSGQTTLGLDVKFSDVMGVKNISYAAFGAKPQLVKFKKLRLRNGGNDYFSLHLRDQFWQSVMDNGQAPPAAAEPVQVWVNGLYYGMLDLREREDETLIESAYGVDNNLTDYMSDNKVLSGANAASGYYGMADFIRSNNMAVAANYDRARQLLDMENFAHDFALHLFAVSTDWGNRNIHAWRMPDYDGRWRYRPHDFDISSAFPAGTFFATAADTDMGGFYGRDITGGMMDALLANPDFYTLYINTIADQLNSILLPARLQARLDTLAAQMRPYLPAHLAKNPNAHDLAAWEAELATLRNFINQREAFHDLHTRTRFGLSARKSLQIGVNDPAMGSVRINTLDLGTVLTAASPSWTGRYYPEVPVTATALPKPGFVFVGWEGAVTTPTPRISGYITVDGLAVTAVFAPASSVPAPSVATVGAQSASTGQWVSLQLQASDARGHTLRYTAKSLPSGLNLHPATGLITGKPTKAGSFATVVTVTNGSTATTLPIAWTVQNSGSRVVNLPLVISGDGAGLVGQYFGNQTFSGVPALTRTELPAVALGSGAAPAPGLATSGWAIRWAGQLWAPVAGNYTVRSTIRRDDGIRVWVDGALVIDNWTPRGLSATAQNQVTLTLGANQPLPIRIEYRDPSGAATLQLEWAAPGSTSFQPMAQGVFSPG